MNRFVAVLLLVIAVTASYAPAVRNGFVWDDTALVLRDPLIRSWRLIPEGFNHYLFVDATASNFYRPLQRLTYTIEYALFTVRPGPYHLTNIALHGAAAVGLLLFAEALLEAFGCAVRRRRWIAFISAFVWAVHPVHSGAIVYVSGRADPLAAFFGFIACWLTLRSIVRPAVHPAFLLAGAGIAFLCSALSKETGLMFPILMIVLLGILRQRRAVVRLVLVTLFVAASYLTLRLPAEHNSPPPIGTPPPVSVRPITISRAVAEYAGLLALPLNLHMERDVRTTFRHSLYDNTSASAARELQTLTGITIATMLLIWTLRARKRDRLVFALLVSAILSYLPISGVIALNASVAEHWIYVPSAFLFLALASAISKRVEALISSRALVATGVAVFALWILFLGGRTFARTFDWKNQRTFLERTIASGGDSARMLINLGSLESSKNHLELARKDLIEALKREPDQPFGVLELAAVAIKQNNFREARDLLGRASEIPLVSGQAHELIAVLDNKEKGQADLLRLRLAAHTGFSNWSIEKRYIKVLAETGATAGAIHELQTCLQSQWYRAESWQLLGQLLAKAGRPEAAAEAMSYANSYDVHLSARPRIL